MFRFLLYLFLRIFEVLFEFDLGLRLLLPSQSAHRIFLDGFALNHKWVHGLLNTLLRRVLGVSLSLSTNLRVEKRHLFVKLLTPFDKVTVF